MSGRTRRWAIALAIGLVAVAATASLALAGKISLGTAGGNDYRQDDNAVAAPDQVVKVLGCGSDDEFVSGGGFGQNAFSAELNDSFPSGKKNWALNLDFEGGGAQTLHAYVICNKGKRSLEEHDPNLALAPNATRSAKSSCKHGKHVIGGGAVIFGPITDARLNSSYPYDGGDKDKKPDDGWKARGVNLSGSQLSFNVIALCAKRAVTYKKATDTISASINAGPSVFCPQSKHVLSGGVKVTGRADESVVQYFYPRDLSGADGDADTTPDDGWLTNVHNEAGEAKKVTAFAVCG